MIKKQAFLYIDFVERKVFTLFFYKVLPKALKKLENYL